jgi:type VI protein secretion system component VasA
VGRRPSLAGDAADLDDVLAHSSFAASSLLPAGCVLRLLLTLKLFSDAGHRHVMGEVLEEGLALFAQLNAIPKRTFITDDETFASWTSGSGGPADSPRSSVWTPGGRATPTSTS